MQQRKLPPAVVIAMVLVITVPAGIFVYSSLMGDMGLTYALTDEGLRIQHEGASLMSPEDRLISYSEITKIQVLDQLPKLHKEWGKNGVKTWVGDFSSDELGTVKAYILNIKWPIVLLKTEDDTILLSPEDTDAFVQQLRAATGE